MKRLLILFVMFFLLVGARSQNNDLEQTRQKEFIKQFIDTYRQAYDKRNLNFISDIFSEKALIITQTLQLRKKKEPAYKDRGKNYSIVIENKKDYIKRLKEIFKSSSYLRLEITTPEIKEHSKLKGLYGVRFWQTWEGDSKNAYLGELHHRGSILLIIDFSNDPYMPTIHVRTWQPELVLKEERRFNLSDFYIRK